jgi:hypothetical protein
VGSFLNENDARFLIDQYNKYASYALKPLDWSISLGALSIAILAVTLSVFSQATHIVAGGWWFEIFELVYLFAIGAFLVFFYHMYSKTISMFRHEQLDHTLRFGYLIEYFLAHKSLPDSITFAYLLTTEPDDLKKLLSHSKASM